MTSKHLITFLLTSCVLAPLAFAEQGPINDSQSRIKEMGGRVFVDAILEVSQPVQIDKYVDFVNVSSPTATPASGHSVLFADANKQFVAKFSDGSYTVLSGAGGGSGDIEGVTAGTGLTGGGTSGTVTLNVNVSSVTMLGPSVTLDEISDPAGNKAFQMANKQVKFSYVAPNTADGGFEIEASGGFSGDLLHVHQHTGNPSAADLVHLESEDADVLPLRVAGAGAQTAVFSGSGKINISSNTVIGGTTIYADGNLKGVSRIVWADGTVQVSSPTAGTSGTTYQASTQCLSTNGFTTTSNAFQSTNLTCKITPASSSSRVRIMVSGTVSNPSADANLIVSLKRGTTDLGASGNKGFVYVYNTAGGMITNVAFSYIDSPATTSETTYTVTLRNDDNVRSMVFGYNATQQVMILDEIQ